MNFLSDSSISLQQWMMTIPTHFDACRAELVRLLQEWLLPLQVVTTARRCVRICFIENQFWVYGFCIWHKLVNVDEIEHLLALFQHRFKVLATSYFRLLLLALKP
jgi:hypothetical protein